MRLWRGVKHHGVVLESVAYQISSVYRFFLLFFKKIQLSEDSIECDDCHSYGQNYKSVIFCYIDRS